MQIKKDEVRQRLIDAACKLFVSNGYVESTVSDLAKEATVGKGTFYTYFRSKEEIVEAIIDEGMAELFEMINHSRLVAKESGKSTFRAFIRANLEFFSKNQAILKFLNREMSGYASLQNKIRVVRERYLASLRTILEQESHTGGLRKDLELGAAAALLYGMLYSSVIHSKSDYQGLSLENLGESIVALFKANISNPALA